MLLPDLPETEQVIIEETNAFRRERNLLSVAHNKALAAAARAFAQYLAETGRFSHTADGRTPDVRATAAGYRHCIVAENLAKTTNSRGVDTRSLADQAITGWKNSPPHREAMLDPYVTEIGVAVVQAPTATPTFLSVQLFARPATFQYTFQIENLSASEVRYTFKDEPIALPARTVMTHTACVPARLQFEAHQGTYQPSDGARYRVVPSTAGNWQIEAITPDGVRSGKNR